MYAVVETGGKQYKVEQGTSLLVDRLDAKEGDKVALRAVMFRDTDVLAAPKELEKVQVEATVAEHLRGPKIKVFKYKAKKGYRRKAGHRSELTKLEVTSLKLGKSAAKKSRRESREKRDGREKTGGGEKSRRRKNLREKSGRKNRRPKKPAAKKAVKEEGSDGS